MLPGVVLFQICDFIFTGLLLYLLNASFIGTNGVEFKEWRGAQDNKVQLEEFRAWSNNTSSIFEPDPFHHYVNARCLALQQMWLKKMCQENTQEMVDLLNVTGLDIQPCLNIPEDIYFGPICHSQINDVLKVGPFSAFNQTDIDILYEQALRMPEFADNITDLRIYRLYPEILVKFATELVARESQLLYKLDNIYNSHKVKLFYQTFVFEDGGKNLTPISAVSLQNIKNMHCILLNDTKEDEFRDKTPSGVTFKEVQMYIADSCYYKVFLNVVKDRSCESQNLIELMFEMFDNSEPFQRAYTLSLFIFIVTSLYVILDVIERCIFLTRSVIYQTSPWDMLMTAFGQKVPGSYLRKQLNIISCISVFVAFLIFRDTLPRYHDLGGNEYYSHMNVAAILFILAIVIRFVMHIHSLRLLPGIGHFVITTFMMGTNLLHFSTVYGIVVLIFSVLFYILIDDTSCPLEKNKEFQTFGASMFSTFRLTFGHGDLDPFFSTMPVQMAYVLYVIIVVLLLLNLIIAIMSTTATNIMSEPWKQVLWKVKWLDEATSVEYTISIMSMPFGKLNRYRPFRKLHKLRHSSHKRAGFIVKRVSERKYNVYIECFQCPALKNRLTADIRV